MASVFTRIIRGELPARFVFRDQHCVAFLSITPNRRGHTLVVPVQEIDHWLDVPASLMSHLTSVAAYIGKAMYQAFPCKKIGMVIAGFEVPHVHIHLIPAEDALALNFESQNHHPDPKSLDLAAESLRGFLEKTVCNFNREPSGNT